MGAVLLAGGPGAGKSLVSSAVRGRGLRSVDLDYGFARWETPEGCPVEFPAEPSMEWLTGHHWQWIESRLDELVADCRSRTGLLCGAAFNMFEHLGRFDLVMLLSIHEPTLEARLRDPRRDNPFGKTGDTVAWSHWWLWKVESELRARGVPTIDGRQPLDRVVDEILSTCAAAGCPLAL